VRNNRNRKKYSKHRPIYILAAVALLLCVWSTVFSLTGTRDILRGATTSLSRPLTSLFDRMGGGIASAVEATTNDYEAWKSEKSALEATIAEQQAALAELQQLRDQNEQLKAYMGLVEQKSELMLAPTRVIYTADTTDRLLTIGIGRRDDVTVGMPVMSAKGLVGRVCEVSRGTAKVQTLLDELLSVGVTNARSGVDGTLCGATDDGELCTLKYLDPNISYAFDLQVGDMIVTSGSSEHYPAGILVGSIVKVGLDPYDHTPYAHVKLSADVRDTSAYLMVVLGEREIELPDETIDENEPSEDIPNEDIVENPLGDETDTEMPSENDPNEPDAGFEDGEVTP
jgi:rod shape-determining protein MreC